MRTLLGVPALCVLVAAAMPQAQTAGSGKVDSQWKCAAPSPVHALPVGDAAGHAYVVQQAKCTATKGEIAGVKEKDGTSTEFMEASGNEAKGHGIFVETLANGDTITISYTFTGMSSNDVLESGSNKWTVAGGTGKLKGMKGSGTCSGKGAGDGSAVFDCTGTYTLAQ